MITIWMAQRTVASCKEMARKMTEESIFGLLKVSCRRKVEASPVTPLPSTPKKARTSVLSFREILRVAIRKPDTITFLFNGGSSPNNPAAQCASSTIDKVPNSKGKFHDDFECSGSVDPSSSVNVQVDGASGTVQPGQTFTVNLKSIKDTRLSNGGGVQCKSACMFCFFLVTLHNIF